MESQIAGLSPLHIDNPFGAPAFFTEECPSTMELARELFVLNPGIASGALVWADVQSAGRGRFRDRAWLALRGQSLLFTIGLRLDPLKLPGLPLRIALGLCYGLEAFGLGRARVKWPNDIMIDDKKMAGVLCEASLGVLYAGIGLNVGQRGFPGELAPKAISLAMALEGRVPGRSQVLVALLQGLYNELSADSEGWRAELEERLYQRGHMAEFQEGIPPDGRLIKGRIVGLGPGGQLLLETEEGRQESLFAGEFLDTGPKLGYKVEP